MKRFLVFVVAFLPLYLAAQPPGTNDGTVFDVDFRQDVDEVVISYRLSQLAKVRGVYLSLDGGETYQGPLNLVQGDVGKEVDYGHHSIVWKAFDEMGAFDSDQVVFKIDAKRVLKGGFYYRNRPSALVFFSANGFRPVSGGIMVGCMFGFGFGLYGKYLQSFTSALPSSTASAQLNEIYDVSALTGKNDRTVVRNISGGICLDADVVAIYFGPGWYTRKTYWEGKSRDGHLLGIKDGYATSEAVVPVEIQDYTREGLSLDVGLIIPLGNHFAVSAGIMPLIWDKPSSSVFKSIEYSVGIGCAF